MAGYRTVEKSLKVTGDIRCQGDLTILGNFTFGDASTDSLTVKGGVLFNGAAVTNAIMFSNTVGTATNGSLMSTGSAWINHSTVGACAIKFLCATTATSGDYATMRIRARSDAVSSGGVEGINVSASAAIANYGNLCAGYFAVQPMAINTTASSGIISAIHAVVDRTGTSSGRTWVAWIDTHQETKSGAGDYLMRMSHNGTVANNGAITVYNGGRMPVLFNFEDAAGFLTDTDPSLSTQAGSIAVTTPAGTRYIALYSS